MKAALTSLGLPKDIQRIVAISAAIHLSAVLAIALGSSCRSHRSTSQEVITTRLVRLGKERPKEFLPRKELPPPAPVVQAKAPVPEPQKPVQKPPDPSAVTVQERVEQMSRLTNALSRLKQTEEPEGSADGSEFGDTATLEGLATSRFHNEIGLCLKRNYFSTAADGSAQRRRKLSAEVALWIDGSGKFVSHKIEKSSGNPGFDADVERAVKGCGKVSPPPAHLREEARADGVLVLFEP